MIVRTTNVTLESYAGEHIDKFITRISELVKAENASSYGSHGQYNNVTVTGKHNNSTIVLSIKHDA